MTRELSPEEQENAARLLKGLRHLAFALLGVFGLIIAAMAVVLAKMMPWGCAAAMAVFFGQVLLLFLYTHPFLRYCQKFSTQPLWQQILQSDSVERWQGAVRLVSIGWALLFGVIFLGAVIPEFISLSTSAVRAPYLAGEGALLYFIYGLLVYRALCGKRVSNYWFTGLFAICVFGFFFGHIYLLNFFYFTSLWGPAAFAALGLAFVGVALTLNKYC